MRYYIGLDNGGTTTKAALFDSAGRELAVCSVSTAMLTPQPDFVERDMEEMWQANCRVLRGVLEKANVSPQDVACVGVDLLVVTRKTARQVGHLLEATVVVHIEREVALRKEFDEGLGGGIFFERCREGGIVHMDFEFHGSLPRFRC